MGSKLARFTAENEQLIDRMGGNHINYHINISLRHRFVFFETPKVACSTVKLFLQRAELDDPGYTVNAEDVHLREFSPLLKPIQLASLRDVLDSPAFFKFCFVRQPYTRALSCYLNKIDSSFRDVRLRKIVLDLLGRQGDPGLEPITFKDFLRAVARQPAREMDPHWRPQYSLLSPDLVAYDVIGRFERLEADLRTVSQRIGIDFERFFQPERPHRTNAADRLRSHYGPEERALVRELYAADFLAFDYDPADLGDAAAADPEPDAADGLVEAAADQDAEEGTSLAAKVA